jgi:hypothetical protein
MKSTTDTANVISSTTARLIHYLKLADKKEPSSVATKYADFTCTTLASTQSKV